MWHVRERECGSRGQKQMRSENIKHQFVQENVIVIIILQVSRRGWDENIVDKKP